MELNPTEETGPKPGSVGILALGRGGCQRIPETKRLVSNGLVWMDGRALGTSLERDTD